VYWELQRVTGRADLRDTWRSLADQLWSGEAAGVSPQDQAARYRGSPDREDA
jgi:hypothetical protein